MTIIIWLILVLVLAAGAHVPDRRTVCPPGMVLRVVETPSGIPLRQCVPEADAQPQR